MSEQQISLQKNILYNSIGNITYFFCQWLTTILVVRLSVGFSDAGVLSLAMSLTGSFVCIANYGLRNYQVSDLKPLYTDGVYVATRMITCLASLVICAVFVWANPYNEDQALCIIAYMFIRLAEAGVDVFHGIDQKAMRMDYIGISFGLRGVGTLVVFIASLYVLQNLFLSIVLMAVFSFFVVLCYDIPHTRRLADIRPQFDTRQIRKLLLLCFPMVMHSFLNSTLQAAPRYFLESLQSREMLGIYASVATPSMIIQMASSYIFSPLVGSFARSVENRDRADFAKLIRKCILAILCVTALAFIAAALLGNWGLTLLFGSQIGEYVWLLYPILLSAALAAGSWLWATVLIVVRDLKALVWGDVFGLATTIILSLLCIRPLGLIGTTIALIGGQIVQVVLSLLMSMHTFKRIFGQS